MRWIARATGVTAALLVALLGLALLTGQVSAVSTRGISMEPGMSQGDLVLVGPARAPRIGDVVAYRSALLSTVVLHRIVDGDSDGFVLQGDNNPWLDPEQPTAADVLGVELLHLPAGGIWLSRLASPPALAAYALVVLAAGSSRAGRTPRQRKETAAVRPAPSSSLTGASLPHALRPVAAGALAVGVLGLGISGLSWSRDATETVEASTQVSSAMRFDYRAEVPQTAAYDGTAVQAPQPLFRRLVDSADVTYRYTGRPGVLSVHAELSTSSGWTSRVPLEGPVEVGTGYDGRVTLDLLALEQRARDAAAAIGAPGGGLTLTIVPSVDLRGGGHFAPRLAFALDETSLSLTGPLEAAEDTATSGSLQQASTFSALGRSIEISQLRIAGIAAMAVAALAGLLLVVAAKLSGPVAEADRIRRRYGDAITSVRPVASLPGMPIVDVASVQSLVRLGESWQLPVLHWAGGEGDTFLVLADGVSYRHCVTEKRPLAAPTRTSAQLPADASWAGSCTSRRRRA